MQLHTTRVTEKNKNDAELRECWDRLVLLLITEPRKGWKREFRQITRRETERLAIRGNEDERHD